MFNNLFYVNSFLLKYASIFVCICCQLKFLERESAHRYRQVTLPKNRTSESAKKITIGASLKKIMLSSDRLLGSLILITLSVFTQNALLKSKCGL